MLKTIHNEEWKWQTDLIWASLDYRPFILMWVKLQALAFSWVVLLFLFRRGYKSHRMAKIGAEAATYSHIPLANSTGWRGPWREASAGNTAAKAPLMAQSAVGAINTFFPI